LFTAPVYRPANNTVELTVSNFFYENPSTRAQTPLDVYLGNLGPLQLRVYQTTPAGPLTTINPFLQPGPQVMDDMGAGSSASSPQRFMPSGPLHTVVIVEMPPLPDVMKALEDDALPTPDLNKSHSPENSNQEGPPVPPPPMPTIAGRSLPLLFIRASDGVGYHSGRTIACENVFQGMDLGNIAGNQGNGSAGNIDTGWIAAAQAAAASADGSMHGWTLRVM
jgi:recombining binding protein (suppressor of hairless)